MIALGLFLKMLGKQIFIYWHESEWHWNGLIPEKNTTKSILYHRIIRILIKISYNITVSNYCKEWLQTKFVLKYDVEVLHEAINLEKVQMLADAESRILNK